MNKIVSWLRQPTTLQGIALLLGAAASAYFGLGEAVAGTMATIAIPLLVPDNTTAQHELSILSTTAIHALAKERSAEAAATVAAEAVESVETKKPT
ncbi:hypothetical protein [Kozakia baliensis]|uniref:Uncharacterized protein n=1 Tax=Kozakia baliensis TaxID=153496 RepID=A0A1D8UTG3_9PROT|nr:hypothetical protein [Kozakia baliensis]AOX16906.1 hypothetical protein A0U89_06905 [Kozakia baliensis]GBR25644.1 hypothetical protein AA0488_0704 [Kozakia baliensis NRIC 0488]GEL64047.1 hypothetical protein KBA01_13330 [Kozakia baliensis]